MPYRIRLVIADDHRLFRQGIISLLHNAEKNIIVTGEAENGKELLKLLRKEEPHVVLLDLDMPVMSGDEAFEMMLKHHPRVKIIVLSMHYDLEMVQDYMERGAYAYLRKESSRDILLDVIQSAHKGIPYSAALSPLYTSMKKNESVFERKRLLSEREIEIIKHICDGKSNKEIAVILNISLRTVDFHRGNIYAKTQAGNPAALAVYALKYGIISF